MKLLYLIAALAVLIVAFDAKAASQEAISTAANYVLCAVDKTTDADILENLNQYTAAERAKVSTQFFLVYWLAVKEFAKCGLDVTQLNTEAGVTLIGMFSEELQAQMKYGSIGR